MKNHALPVSVVGFLVLSGCGSAATSVEASPSSDAEEAVSVRKEDCVFGTSLGAFFETAEAHGFSVTGTILKYETLTFGERMQLKSVFALADDAALESLFKDGGIVNSTRISELGGPRAFELFRASVGRMLPTDGTFVLAGTSAVVAQFSNFDDIKSCMVTKLGGLDLRGRKCAFGGSVATWTDAGLVKLGDRRAITASTPLSAMRKAQLLGAAESSDLPALLSAPFDEIYYRTVTVPGLDEKFTYVWHYPGDTEVGAIFRQGSADVVARVGDEDIYQCLVAALTTPKATPTE